MLQDIEVIEILIWYDMPQLFTIKDSIENNYVCIFNIEYFIAIPLSNEELNILNADNWFDYLDTLNKIEWFKLSLDFSNYIVEYSPINFHCIVG